MAWVMEGSGLGLRDLDVKSIVTYQSLGLLPLTMTLITT